MIFKYILLTGATLYLTITPAFAIPALGESHYFFSGFFAGTSIIGAQFDDVTSSLTLVNNISTDVTAGSKWITLDV